MLTATIAEHLSARGLVLPLAGLCARPVTAEERGRLIGQAVRVVMHAGLRPDVGLITYYASLLEMRLWAYRNRCLVVGRPAGEQ